LISILKWWLGFTTNHKQKIQVPDLNKMSLTEVETTLKELNLDFIVIDSASYNPNYPKKISHRSNSKIWRFCQRKKKNIFNLKSNKI
jgi:spore coat polysaccharide biosynthesis predicted glycosyltransferase SpsG